MKNHAVLEGLLRPPIELYSTAVAWGVQLPSAHAIARRAPHGHVPLRTLRRSTRTRCGRAPAPA